MFSYCSPYGNSRQGPTRYSNANILFPPADSADIFEWIQLQKELERKEAERQRELRKPRIIKKVESEDDYQLQIFKEQGNFSSYEVEAKKKPGNRVHLTISSDEDQFSKTFEFSLNEIEVSKIDWEYYKTENVLVLNIPKKQQVEYRFYSHPLFGLIQQQPESVQVQQEDKREIAHRKALEYKKRAEQAREKAHRKRAEAEERRRVEAEERKRAEAEERKRAEAEERKRIEERKRAEAERNRAEAERKRVEVERKRAEAERRREQQEQAAAVAAFRELQKQAYIQLQRESQIKAQLEKEEAQRREDERQAKIERERADYREAQRQAHRRQQEEASRKAAEQESKQDAPQVQNIQLNTANPEEFLQQLFGTIFAANQTSSTNSQAPLKATSVESPVSKPKSSSDFHDSDNESIDSDLDPETPEPASPKVVPSSAGPKLARLPSLEEVEDEEFVMFKKKFGQ